jgi:hypothetical protein
VPVAINPLPLKRVEAAPWELFLDWWHDAWEPGQHVALIGPTGQGKSTFAVGILKLRKWVLALDAKGGDDTLAASGFKPVKAWPPPSKIRDEIAEGKPARLIVTGSTRTKRDMGRLVALMQESIEGARAEGGWTVYADEFQILADMRMFALGIPVEQMLISARSAGSSVVTSFQAPAWVPKAGTRQASFTVMLKTQSVDMIKTVSEAVGRDWHDLRDALGELPKFYVLVIPQDIHAPMVCTHAPKIS